MEKSFYYSIEWSELSCLKDDLNAMKIPFLIEQPSDKLDLVDGHVALVFPVIGFKKRLYIIDLLGSFGKRYPE
ncbi:hypothetical protein [Brevibacillus sp. HD1.4A]|uniref:hypothetical protein n=1 Tax=Brevibacillus sp. HD1.4A TaxID=2738978 RepID=UPI00156B774D|nr:hypothetical protein [Brevibacillus sp. HD1.4A]NRQ51960.1 hypothetical protein [Brevibacillus sp. HD1.4A]